MNREEMAEYLGEAFHTAFRKASDSPQADRVWHLIEEMPPPEWAKIVDFVVDSLPEGVVK